MRQRANGRRKEADTSRLLKSRAGTGACPYDMVLTAHPTVVKKDEVVKILGSLVSVIPAKAGIQVFRHLQYDWTPVFTGVTTCYGIIL